MQLPKSNMPLNNPSFALSNPGVMLDTVVKPSPAESLQSGLRSEPQLRNNFKWTYQQHAKYIYFLELNKIRIKSRFIRKSNAFFKDMQKFIQTKTALQCRSHHQKFEQRYKFPHRIITGQKKHIPIETYKTIIENHKFTDNVFSGQTKRNDNVLNSQRNLSGRQQKVCMSISCQTDLCDVNQKIFTEEQVNSILRANYPLSIQAPMCSYTNYPLFYWQ